jgi:hypothetical protein
VGNAYAEALAFFPVRAQANAGGTTNLRKSNVMIRLMADIQDENASA